MQLKWLFSSWRSPSEGVTGTILHNWQGGFDNSQYLVKVGCDIASHRFYVASNLQARPGENRDMEFGRDVIAAYWGFMIVSIGTIVWAFGDLVGCLIAQNMDCVA